MSIVDNLTPEQLQWLAGVIDAEGSFEMHLNSNRRGSHRVKIRRVRMRIKTTDNIITFIIGKWFGKIPKPSQHKHRTVAYTVTLRGGELRQLLPKLQNYLYIKQPHAIICLQALNIKAGRCLAYEPTESRKWEQLRLQLRELNKRGKSAPNDNYPRQHVFSWPWLAGIIDGDGTVTVGAFGPRRRPTLKPAIKLSLTNLLAIDYLANRLSTKPLSSGKARGNRRQCKAIRLMSEKILEIAPHIIPHLTLKQERTKTAHQIVYLRHAVPNGQYNHPNIAKAKELLKLLER